MAEPIELSWDDRKLKRLIARFPEKADKAVKVTMRRAGSAFTAEMKQRTARGRPLRSRTGKLAGSFGSVVTGSKIDNLELRVFSAGVPYARIHEHGGTIKPTGGRKFLTIPIDDNLTPAGVARNPSAAALRNDPSRKTRILRVKSGNLYIVEDTPGDVKFLFRLVPQVVLPPRLGFRDTFNAQRSRRGQILGEEVTKALSEAAK